MPLEALMKKIILTTLIFSIFPITVQAGTVYLEKPDFYKLDPKLECVLHKSPYEGVYDGVITDKIKCGEEHFQDQYRTPVTDDQNNVSVLKEKGKVVGTCKDGLCTTTRNEEYMGKLEAGDTHFVIPLGYYIYQTGTDEIYAYQQGTGPKADTFGKWAVEGDESAPVENTLPQYEPSEIENPRCFTKNDVLICDINGLIVGPEELLDITSMADVDAEQSMLYNCSGPLCFGGTSNKFLGLNPFWYDRNY